MSTKSIDPLLIGIQNSCREAKLAMEFLQSIESQENILKIAKKIADTFRAGNKLLIVGNGGSLCDAMHVAEEFTGYFRQKRRALPAIALADSSHITCVGNDTSFREVFSRGIEALGVSGDLLILLTTSGRSENIVEALKAGKMAHMTTVAFLGKTGGIMKGMADYEMVVPGFSFSDRIQEVHMAALHIIIETVEAILFPPSERDS